MSSGAPAKGAKLASERVIINAPMSFAGSAQRSWRIRRGPWPALVLLTIVALVLTMAWWVVVVVWYVVTLVFLWFLTVPYRLLRRGARKRKAEALRHREVLSALDKKRD
jgi:hypothetical protein